MAFAFRIKIIIPLALLACLLSRPLPARENPIVDSLGNTIMPDPQPSRLVSLVPGATEILFELGAQNAVAGLTFHDTRLDGAGGKAVVGGFFSPSVEKIKALDPDFVILSSLHQTVAAGLKDTGCRLFFLDTRGIDQAFETITTLGRLFGLDDAARNLIQKNKDEIAFIREKVEKAVPKKHLRVMRLMGRKQVMTPGSDSFQNELIRFAGGIPPDFGKKGPVVDVTLKEWQDFNPQVIYGCGNDRLLADRFFKMEGWKDVDAVKNGRIYYFPCELTCRAATRTGYFVSWLSSMIYTKEFADPKNDVRPMELIRTTPLKLDLPYVKSAGITVSRIMDFENKTLVIDFKSPQHILSTLEGERQNILTVGNHYSPPPTWGPGHHAGIDVIRTRILAANKRQKDTASFLVTGADMGNLSVKESAYKAMRVTVLATAGVLSNALRMSKDKGMFYEPGTINILILTNMKLSQRAMAKAVISATEAKTCAMEDLDIRSTYTPLPHGATGTGTDNILVVRGEGVPIDNSGGHAKMGELIAKAVYSVVNEAVYKQNGLTPDRHIHQRLKERKLSLYGLTANAACDCLDTYRVERRQFARTVEHLLLEPEYASFLSSALAISDDHERGLIKDLTLFETFSRTVASDIAGHDVGKIEDLVNDERVPVVLETALNALFTGALERLRHE